MAKSYCGYQGSSPNNEIAEEGVRLRGCTVEQFVVEAVEKALEEEKSKR